MFDGEAAIPGGNVEGENGFDGRFVDHNVIVFKTFFCHHAVESR